MPLLEPVTLSVSSSISFLMAGKSMNFLPLQWRNSPYSFCELISCRIRGRRVTIPLPRGRKSLEMQCWHYYNERRFIGVKQFLGLTSRRSSRVPTTFPRIVHRRRRFGAGRWPWALPVRWRHPASDWWSGSGPPYPDSLVAQTFWQEVLRAKLLGQTRALLAYGPEDVSGFTEDTLNQD